MTLAPADVEAALVTLLGAKTRIPNPRPTELTKVSRAGGDEINAVQVNSRVLVECWAATEVAAFNRARTAWAALRSARDSFIGGVWVSRVELTDPVNFPDPDTSSPRYQFVAQLTASLQEIT